jgi:hypothetical protein
MTHHIIPGCHYRFHVEITWEESDYTIGDNLAIFHEDASKISNDRWIISDFEPRANGHLITATGNDLLKKCERAGTMKSKNGPKEGKNSSSGSWDKSLAQRG